ncbi:hypothetical protein [Croceibacterium aestuarii]|uniref:hypothetical protein n=1 Tax=Croceibacterium aestuarii TaxID=3064139 RepID=UPI00272E6C66|nr:hypothetical protein [Croceibacterium sp. D39]
MDDPTQPHSRTLSPALLLALGTLGALALPGAATGQAGDRGKMLDQPAITAALDVGHAGNFTGLIDPRDDELCYMLNAPVDAPTRAVIADDGGTPLVTLATPDARGASAGCIAIAPAAVKALTGKNADDYALVIDTRDYPAEVRAPLHAMPSPGSA